MPYGQTSIRTDKVIYEYHLSSKKLQTKEVLQSRKSKQDIKRIRKGEEMDGVAKG